MKPPPFHYHRPQTREELGTLLASLDNAKILAGGQSLMPMLNLRVIAPDHLIDINRIPELAGIRETADGIEIGAMTRQADILSSPIIRSRLPLLARALEHVGHIQTRSRGTIGGSCCHLDPSAEQPAICAALDAEFVAIGPNGRRVIPAAEWFQGMLQSSLDDQEFLETVRFRPWAKGHGYGFAEYARRHGDFAISGAAALLEADDSSRVTRAALLVFGVEEAPRRLYEAEATLVGQIAGQIALAPILDAARALDPMEDVQVTADYRRHLAGTLLGRALREACTSLELRQ
ncbi:xanthine dehydrogenase family protein subunit M [Bradyrhizobium sp. 182]|uniref:FAD binding domain-containing protein n=1 Tax=unclassified Bradyrhizobium TaxID=2631580 RepID=UPI001FF93F73|nr:MULTISPECIES: xanthine dehydrogenase family protein subunit M [unclassified Bradyrhizobium]MCK1423008.1 xanthine dehydrogenase family protein subunit M [Bradyrhizobium sp. CW12]MCK1529375.1 xanthine dehydrogenase family protein subunit M [Bradyrhizobium sp. 182]MCK1643775.1 xanthine dehydrogenase family protein subunit M [Bradyrhizobium sp. 154]